MVDGLAQINKMVIGCLREPSLGPVFGLKGGATAVSYTHLVPLASRTSKGIPIVNLLNLDKDEKVLAMVPVERENSPAKFLFFVTAQGIVKRVPIEEFENIRQSGKIAINLREGDELISAKPTTGSSQILIAAAKDVYKRQLQSGMPAEHRAGDGAVGGDSWKRKNADDSSEAGFPIQRIHR